MVNLVTKARRRGSDAEFGAQAGSFNTRGAYADVWGSLNENITGRVIADVEKSDGFRGLSRDINEISPSLIWHLA